MTEGGEGPKIEIAPARSSPGELSQRAGELRRQDIRQQEQRTSPVARVDLGPLAREFQGLRQGITDLFRELETERLTPEQAMSLAAKQSQEIAAALGQMDPEKERENWIDLEYRQEFWQRFEPRSWPRFYGDADYKERRKWDARWQLARAAFYKKATAAFPDKYAENQDLLLLGKDQMEVLYNTPGVKRMLRAYVDVIAGNTVVHGVGSFWQCKDQDDFERFREGMRNTVLHDESNALAKKEADAVAWNLIWVGNLVESVDSRYSFSGQRHGDLPGAIVADEYRWTMHIQEKGETKWEAHHTTWGAFGKWGVAQIERIEKQRGYARGKDKFVFTPARRTSQFWDSRVRGRTRDGGRTIEVFVPECYPASSTKSFWEETKAKGVPLLDYMLKGEDIPWQDVKADSWGAYVIGKFNKAVKFAEYYNPGVPMESQKPGYAKTWALPFMELLVRLRPQDLFNNISEKKKRNILYSLKFWAVLAANDGVKDPSRRQPEINLTFGDATALARALSGRRIGFFTKREARKFLSIPV